MAKIYRCRNGTKRFHWNIQKYSLSWAFGDRWCGQDRRWIEILLSGGDNKKKGVNMARVLKLVCRGDFKRKKGCDNCYWPKGGICCLSVHLSVCLPFHPSIHASIHLWMFLCLSVGIFTLGRELEGRRGFVWTRSSHWLGYIPEFFFWKDGVFYAGF